MQHVRVSEILAQFRDFSQIDQRVLTEKQDIGTEVHKNIHLHTKGVLPIFDKFPVRNFNIENGFIIDEKGEKKPDLRILRWEERGEGYFESYLRWEEKEQPSYEMMEERFFCDNLMVTGQMDAIVRKGDGLMLIDYKCSASADLEIWGMQAHFYKYLLEMNGIVVGEEMHWIKLDKSGKKPNVSKIMYDEKVMDRCIEAAIRYWEERSDAKRVA